MGILFESTQNRFVDLEGNFNRFAIQSGVVLVHRLDIRAVVSLGCTERLSIPMLMSVSRAGNEAHGDGYTNRSAHPLSEPSLCAYR